MAVSSGLDHCRPSDSRGPDVDCLYSTPSAEPPESEITRTEVHPHTDNCHPYERASPVDPEGSPICRRRSVSSWDDERFPDRGGADVEGADAGGAERKSWIYGDLSDDEDDVVVEKHCRRVMPPGQDCGAR